MFQQGQSDLLPNQTFLVAEVIKDKKKKSIWTGCHKMNGTELMEIQPLPVRTALFFCVKISTNIYEKTTVLLASVTQQRKARRKATLKKLGLQ